MKDEKSKLPKGWDEDAELVLMRERAHIADSCWSVIYNQWDEDVKFLAGEQWPDAVKQLRKDRVMLTINQLPKYERRVIGVARMNKIKVKVTAAEAARTQKIIEVPNVAGTASYSLPEVMENAVEQVQVLSRADQAYDRALKHAVDGGIGWLRVKKRYAQPAGFEQELVVRGVRIPRSVLYDPMALVSDEPDFSAGRWCFVVTQMSRREAEKKYGKEHLTDFSLTADLPYVDYWHKENTVTIAEYLFIESKACEYVLLNDGKVMRAKDYEAAKSQLSVGVRVVARREGEDRQVWQALTDGFRFIEKPVMLDTQFIPLVPVLGPDVVIDGEVRFEGLFRHSQDAQRMYNYWRSAATEAVALAPKAPWIADAASVKGYEAGYRQATSEPTELLLYHAREGIPPPQRVSLADTPAAEIQQAMHANEDIKSTVGIFDASLGAKSNETSGVAIQARSREAEAGTFVWIDALATAIEHVGRILVDWIPKVFDTERQVRINTSSNGEDFVVINYTLPDGSGQVAADLGSMRYDVRVSAGPSMSNQRAEAVQGMLQFAQAVGPVAPNAILAMIDLFAQNQDWPGATDIAARLKKLVPPEVLSDAERQQMAKDNPPSPEQQQAQQAAQEIAQMEARAKEIGARAALIEAEAKLQEANALAPERVQAMIAEALAEVLAAAGLASPAGSPPAA